MNESQVPRPYVPPPATLAAATPERLLAAARTVGDRLATLALRDAEEIDWVGVSLVREEQWSLAPVGINLYDGLSGIALFLAHLDAVTHTQRHAPLVEAVWHSLQRDWELIRQYVRSVGGFAGLGGLIYFLTHLGTLSNRPELLDRAAALVEDLPPLIDQDETFDLLSGSAGCIVSLLGLHACRPTARTVEVAVHCGNHLVAGARPMSHGVGWAMGQVQSEPLAGFSHGAAGIAWALFELAALTGQDYFRNTALQALAYERTLFSAKHGNWRDLRKLDLPAQAGQDNPEQFMLAWCHGAPGIGLGRLNTLKHLDDPDLRTEIDVALNSTLARGFGGNHSLCHGSFGNLELLLQAGQILNEPSWLQRAYQVASSLLDDSDDQGWLCGVPLGVETPGLMTGLAGIGYELLRLAAPERVPSVLTLEPPKRSTPIALTPEPLIDYAV